MMSGMIIEKYQLNAQSFEQPRDYNFTNKQKNTKPKFVIGIEEPNDNSNKKKIIK